MERKKGEKVEIYYMDEQILLSHLSQPLLASLCLIFLASYEKGWGLFLLFLRFLSASFLHCHHFLLKFIDYILEFMSITLNLILWTWFTNRSRQMTDIKSSERDENENDHKIDGRNTLFRSYVYYTMNINHR